MKIIKSKNRSSLSDKSLETELSCLKAKLILETLESRSINSKIRTILLQKYFYGIKIKNIISSFV